MTEDIILIKHGVSINSLQKHLTILFLNSKRSIKMLQLKSYDPSKIILIRH